jgi:hypothetical protein
MKKGWFFDGLQIRGPFYDIKLYPYEDLPPVKLELDDNFKWLLDQSKPRTPIYRYPNMSLSRLIELEAQINIKLPKSFINFVQNEEICCQLPKTIGYQFLLPKNCVKTVGKYKGFLLQFMAGDYGEEVCLYIDKTGDHFVVQGFFITNSLKNEEVSFFYGEKTVDLQEESVYFCASSFKEFIYRLWIEGSIYESDSCLPEWLKQDYINHYLSLK